MAKAAKSPAILGKKSALAALADRIDRLLAAKPGLEAPERV
jgi:hypothetical protein